MRASTFQSDQGSTSKMLPEAIYPSCGYRTFIEGPPKYTSPEHFRPPRKVPMIISVKLPLAVATSET